MAWTHDQKMAATILGLASYKSTLSPSDPEYAKVEEHQNWRAAADAVMVTNRNRIKGGFATGQGLDTPPPPPAP